MLVKKLAELEHKTEISAGEKTEQALLRWNSIKELV